MILEAKDLKKSFPGSPPLDVLKGVNLMIKPGETVAIMGGSGEGKSTLLNLLGTLDTPSDGSLTIDGKRASGPKGAKLRNQHIGFIFQSYYLLEDFTVLENVLMPIRIGRGSLEEGEKRARDLLTQVGLRGKEEVKAKVLSGGEKQRVAIARALANSPDIILADEPTGNLDRDHSLQIQDLILSMAKEDHKAVIVVTHNEEFASRCDRLLFLKGGQLYNHKL